MKSDMYVSIGDPVKALDDSGKVGGYLVRFTTEKDPDIHGDFFTAKTYFGPKNGDGVDMFFHHAMPIKAELAELADHNFGQIKTRKDELGIWAEAVLNLADRYEKLVHGLVTAGKLGWSSGTARHLIKKSEAGEILRWPIIEGSLTPTPAEPRNAAVAVKSLDDFLKDTDLKDTTHDEIKQIANVRDLRVFLCEKGLSKNQADHLICQIKAALALGDPDELADLKAQLQKYRDQVIDLKAANLRLRFPLPS